MDIHGHIRVLGAKDHFCPVQDVSWASVPLGVVTCHILFPLMVAVLATLAQDTSWIAEFIDTLGVIVACHNFYEG